VDKEITRKDFLLKSSKAAVGITAIAGASSLLTTATVKGKATLTPWPWSYAPVDLESIRIRAHHLKLSGYECCSGCFGAFVEAQTQLIGDPWTTMPYEVMLYGRGGGASWGTLCGAVNAAAAVISLVVDKANSGPLIWEVYGWAASSLMPSDEANQFALDNKYTAGTFNGISLPQSVSGSVLCHASLTNWCIEANKKFNSADRKERCARITGDLAVKTGEVLNAYFAGTFVPEYVTPAYAQQCLTCHGAGVLENVRVQESCEPCHGNPHSPQNVITEGGGIPAKFELSQNYPNPFNPNTKIQFAIPNEGKVALGIHDITGQEIKKLIDHDLLHTGKYSVEWDGTDNFGNKVTSGIYFARMTVGQMQKTIKMNLLK
jgi:hypothetical protein